MSGDGVGTPIGAGRVAEVFLHPAGVLKLYRPSAPKASAFREAAILAQIGALGLPVPEVISAGPYKDRWGIVMTRASGNSFARMLEDDPAIAPSLATAMARLHRRLHAAGATRLPGLKTVLAANIRKAAALDDRRRRGALDRLATLPDGDRLCHGDFHPFNVLGSVRKPTVIDWLDASRGAPSADVCRSFVLMHPYDAGFAHAYVRSYAAFGVPSVPEIMAWLPCVAAARLAEGVAEIDALMAMVESG